MTEISAVGDHVARLGECPLWSTDEQALYWVDIDGRSVRRHDPNGTDDSREISGRPGSLALTGTPGKLLVAMEHELVWLDWATGSTTPWVELEPAGTGNRLNDGRCDPAGRFVVGSMYEDTSAGRTTGVLHRVSADGNAEELRHNIGVTNGLAFDLARGRMYFADSPTGQVIVSDYDSETGRIANDRVFFDYAGHAGKPDGACVDADGCYWSASVYGWAVIRITPDGVVDRRIELPVKKPSMPAFGGPDLSTLYVTSIGVGSSGPSEAARDQFEHGALLAIDAGVQGAPEPTFASG